jgi:hypothetical protein
MDKINKKGIVLYRKNKNFKMLVDIMENKKFREFYNLYLKDVDNIKLALLFMKLYETVEKNSKVKLTPYQKISIVKDIFENRELRSQICQNINNSIETKKDNIILKLN